MDDTMPILLVPGLGGSPRVYAPVIPALWRFGPVTVANHIRDDSIGAIARRILAEAPPRFALAGHSMGGYLAFEIMRQAPERVAKLALICTQARPDSDEAIARRKAQIASIEAGGFHDVIASLYPVYVHPRRRDDADLRTRILEMMDDVGPEAFVRQLTAIIGRADSRPTLATIACPVLVLSADQDGALPKELSIEIADGIPGAKLVILDDCGHHPQFEQPQATIDALLGWLRN
jgi:pimeloyl-ACP methyl ester carboxylesterase